MTIFRWRWGAWHCALTFDGAATWLVGFSYIPKSNFGMSDHFGVSWGPLVAHGLRPRSGFHHAFKPHPSELPEPLPEFTFINVHRGPQ